MKVFVVRVAQGEEWRFPADVDEQQIRGFGIAAFTPWGAGMKAYRYGLLTGGLKNYEVVDGQSISRPFYPDRISPLSLLDAPIQAMRRIMS